VPTVVNLRTGRAFTVQTAADAFLDSLRTPNTLSTYTTAVTKTTERLGAARPLAAVADDEIGEALELLWGTSAANTWNARRAGALSWPHWCTERGHDAPRCPSGPSAHPARLRHSPASRTAIDRLIGRRDVHVREKTLWRMLYETTARAEEILPLNIWLSLLLYVSCGGVRGAYQARSAGSYRTWPAFRRSTAFLCRSAISSASFA
jgi:site-specific recombinase XerD